MSILVLQNLPFRRHAAFVARVRNSAGRERRGSGQGRGGSAVNIGQGGVQGAGERARRSGSHTCHLPSQHPSFPHGTE